MKMIQIEVKGSIWEIPAVCTIGCSSFKDALADAIMDGMAHKVGPAPTPYIPVEPSVSEPICHKAESRKIPTILGRLEKRGYAF